MKRYDIDTSEGASFPLIESEDGDWVDFNEALKVIETLKKELKELKHDNECLEDGNRYCYEENRELEKEIRGLEELRHENERLEDEIGRCEKENRELEQEISYLNIRIVDMEHQ